MFGDKHAWSCQLTLKWFRKKPIHIQDVYRKRKNDDKANRVQCKQLMNLGRDYIGVPYTELVYKFQIL